MLTTFFTRFNTSKKQQKTLPHLHFRSSTQSFPHPVENFFYKWETLSNFFMFLFLRKSGSARYRHEKNSLSGTYHFIESEKFEQGEFSPRFRVIFASAKIKLGEAKDVFAHISTDKAINLQGFCLFFVTFFSQREKSYFTVMFGIRG